MIQSLEFQPHHLYPLQSIECILYTFSYLSFLCVFSCFIYHFIALLEIFLILFYSHIALHRVDLSCLLFYTLGGFSSFVLHWVASCIRLFTFLPKYSEIDSHQSGLCDEVSIKIPKLWGLEGFQFAEYIHMRGGWYTPKWGQDIPAIRTLPDLILCVPSSGCSSVHFTSFTTNW